MVPPWSSAPECNFRNEIFQNEKGKKKCPKIKKIRAVKTKCSPKEITPDWEADEKRGSNLNRGKSEEKNVWSFFIWSFVSRIYNGRYMGQSQNKTTNLFFFKEVWQRKI
jgi:hypothetical protein